MRVAASLSGVQPRGCSKPSCRWLGASLHRHHKQHQALWLGPWAHRRGQRLWEAFKARYAEFHSEDCVLLCANHHAEIHSIYDEIIAEDRQRTALPLYRYSWKQARILMRKLEAACEVWLRQESPGIDSELYGRTRRLRWQRLAAEARKKSSKPRVGGSKRGRIVDP